MSSSTTTITLTPATTRDIPVLAQISQEAFSTDTHTRLKELVNGTKHASDMTGGLESWLSRPKEKCKVMKAVTPKGEIVGWTCWSFSGFEYDGTDHAPTEFQVEKPVQKEKESEVKNVEETKAVQNLEDEKKKISELRAITSGSLREWGAKLTPEGSKCVILVAIPILPAYQGKGIGSALIKWGTSIADVEGAHCWVSSSDGGWTAFKKSGFGEVGRLEVDLDDFAGAVRNEFREDGKWGNYVFRYMRRDVVPQS
jgi:predicted N-acetyltransferase YhbS